MKTGHPIRVGARTNCAEMRESTGHEECRAKTHKELQSIDVGVSAVNFTSDHPTGVKLKAVPHKNSAIVFICSGICEGSAVRKGITGNHGLSQVLLSSYFRVLFPSHVHEL